MGLWVHWYEGMKGEDNQPAISVHNSTIHRLRRIRMCSFVSFESTRTRKRRAGHCHPPGTKILTELLGTPFNLFCFLGYTGLPRLPRLFFLPALLAVTSQSSPRFFSRRLLTKQLQTIRQAIASLQDCLTSASPLLELEV